MTVAYLHSVGGASGDMLLGALVDAGLSLEHLEHDLRLVSLPEFSLGAREVRRGHINATLLDIRISGGDTSLSAQELVDRVLSSALDAEVKTMAVRVLDNLLDAECRVHRVRRDELKLHEVGSVDTLIDVVRVVAGLRRLGVSAVTAGPIAVGTVQPPGPRSYPVPAPATLELAAMAGAPVEIREGVAHEMTTPTGAAILTTLATFDAPRPLTLSRVGYGAGNADLPSVPNVLAVWLGDDAAIASNDTVVLLETNIDDVPGTVLGYVQERLFEGGALDVWCTPVQMKKNRPGVVLSALVPVHLQERAVEIMLRETPTLGIRVRPVDRTVARRETVEFQSEYGPVRVKVKYLGDRPVAAAPEYEDCRALAARLGMPLQDLQQRVASQARASLVD